MIVIDANGVRKDVGPAKARIGSLKGITHKFEDVKLVEMDKAVKRIAKTSQKRLGDLVRKECSDCGRYINISVSRAQSNLTKSRYCAMCLEDRKDERLKGLRV